MNNVTLKIMAHEFILLAQSILKFIIFFHEFIKYYLIQ